MDTHADRLPAPRQIEWVTLIATMLPSAQLTTLRTWHGGSCGFHDQHEAPVALDRDQDDAPALRHCPKPLGRRRSPSSTDRPPRERALVVLAAGRVAAVLPHDAPAPVPVDAIWDLPRATLLPGLIDLHVHFTFDSSEAGMLLSRARDATDEELLSTGLANAQAALRAGITSARECGARSDLAHRLKGALATGAILGPRLLVAGRPLTTRGGHLWFLGGAADGLSEAHRRVEEELARGADFIKIMATGGALTPGSNPWQLQFEASALRALVAQVHAAGKRVAAHAHATAGIRACVDAGVDTIEHATFLGPHGVALDDDLASRLADSPSWTVSTLVAIARLAEGERDNALNDAAHGGSAGLLADRLSVVGGLHRAHARIAAGSDAGVTATYPADFADEPGLLVQAGLAPFEAIRAATLDAARAAGIDHVTGSVEVGKSADLLLVDGDPLVDPTALRRPLAVVKNGELVSEPAGAPTEGVL